MTTVIMAIKLSVLVNFVMVMIFKYGFGEEICVNHFFKANCSTGEFVLIEGALLGRFSNSKCYDDQAADQPDCFSDIKTALQERFGANDSFSFSMADEFIYGGLPECRYGLPFSLNISHRCEKVFEVDCDSNTGDENHLSTIEGSNLEVRCKVRFPKRLSSPVVQCLRNGNPISHNITEKYHPSAPSILKTGLLKVLLGVNASDDGALFSCRVAFGSSNAEEFFVYHWNFTASVWHGPNNIWIDPVKSVYDSGDRIRCHADGNPDPVFTWRSISVSGDEDLNNGSVLTLRGASLLSESALALECTATNRISGFSVTKSLNVTISSGTGVPLSYRYLVVGASCGFVILIFLIAILTAALMRCRGSCGSGDDLYIVQAINNNNKQNKQQNFEHVNAIYSNDSSEGEEEEGGGGGGGRGGAGAGGAGEEVIYAEADETSFASCPTAPSKRRLPGDGCAVYEAPVTTEDNDYLNVDAVDAVDDDCCYDNARSLPLHTKDNNNGKGKEKDNEQEYRNVVLAGVNEYSTLAPQPTVTTFRHPVSAANNIEYVSVDHTACRKTTRSSKGGPEGP